MRYIEFGVGNRWLVRTETELEDGIEHEERNCSPYYFTIYLSQNLDWEDGFHYRFLGRF